MNKILGCVCTALCVFNAYSEKAGLEPTIYADISESAQEDAVSFDGIRGLIGLGIAFQNFNAATANNGNSTEQKMNLPGIFMGMEYSKAFRKGFLVAVDVGLDVNKSKKKEGDWNTLNKAYESERGLAYPGNRTGRLKTDALTPSLGLKCGYLLSNYHSVVFLKFGVSKVSGTYSYKVSEAKVCDVDVGAFVPFIGIGAERKINSKWGIALEANLPVKKTVKERQDSVEHKIKVGRTDLRIMGTYSISDK